MIPLVLFVLMIIIMICLTVGAWLLYCSDICPMDVLTIFGAVTISWISTILFASGNIGETSYYLNTTTTTAENITVYTYDLMTIPIMDNVVSVVLMIVSIAITLIAVLITMEALHSLASNQWSD